MYACSFRHVHAYAPVWKPEQVEVMSGNFLNHSQTYIEAESFTKSRTLCLSGLLSSQLALQISVSASSAWGSPRVTTLPFQHLCRSWGSKFRSPYWWGMCFTCWAIAQQKYFKLEAREDRNGKLLQNTQRRRKMHFLFRQAHVSSTPQIPCMALITEALACSNHYNSSLLCSVHFLLLCLHHHGDLLGFSHVHILLPRVPCLMHSQTWQMDY